MRAKSIRRLIQLLLLISIPCAATTWELSKADKNHLSFQLRECKADDIARYNPPFQTPNSCFLVLVTNHARHKIKWSAPAPYLPATHFFAESGAVHISCARGSDMAGAAEASSDSAADFLLPLHPLKRNLATSHPSGSGEFMVPKENAGLSNSPRRGRGSGRDDSYCFGRRAILASGMREGFDPSGDGVENFWRDLAGLQLVGVLILHRHKEMVEAGELF